MKMKIASDAGVLLAKVNQQLTIYPEGHLDVSTEIEAENASDASISLNKPYKIPMEKAFAVMAVDSNGDPLEAYQKGGYIVIVFKPNTVLPPKHKFKFRVTYRTPGFGKRGPDNKYLAIFSIAPGKNYKRVPIQNHRVTIVAIFKKPKPKISWLFNGVSVRQEPNPAVPLSDKKDKLDQTELHFTPFDLGRNGELKITFNYHYGFSPASSSLRRVLSPAISLILSELIKLIAGRIR
jgi:hypothetical protein